MRPASGTLANSMYTCGVPYAIQRLPTTVRGEHRMYATTDCRCTISLPQGTLGRREIRGTKAIAGNAICLPYDNDHISSVRLPFPAALLGIDFFYTANMSGCKFFVDSIPGSQDVIVYHANSNPPGTGQNALPDYQAAAVTNALDTLHANAQNDYAPIALVNRTSLAKPQYNQAAAVQVMLKRARVDARRQKFSMDIKERDVHFTGGTTIVGYPGGAGWEFYYQTWGYISYTRPSGFLNVMTGVFTFHWNYLHKLATRGTEEEIIAMSVLDSGQF